MRKLKLLLRAGRRLPNKPLCGRAAPGAQNAVLHGLHGRPAQGIVCPGAQGCCPAPAAQQAAGDRSARDAVRQTAKRIEEKTGRGADPDQDLHRARFLFAAFLCILFFVLYVAFYCCFLFFAFVLCLKLSRQHGRFVSIRRMGAARQYIPQESGLFAGRQKAAGLKGRAGFMIHLRASRSGLCKRRQYMHTGSCRPTDWRARS